MKALVSTLLLLPSTILVSGPADPCQELEMLDACIPPQIPLDLCCLLMRFFQSPSNFTPGIPTLFPVWKPFPLLIFYHSPYIFCISHLPFPLECNLISYPPSLYPLLRLNKRKTKQSILKIN